MLQVKKLDSNAKLPTIEHSGEDLGYDLYALEDTILLHNEPTKVRTGIAAYFAPNFFNFNEFGLLIRDRSSMASKGITVSGGVVDAGYRGEIQVILTDYTKRDDMLYLIKAGDKIAQMIPIPVYADTVEEVEELPEASRGEKGFGSSGQ